MAFTPAFLIGNTQTGDTNDPSAIILTDSSVGSDVLITSRSILLYEADNSLLGGAAIPWAIGTNPITINPLTIDIALSITINWLNAGGTILYTTSQLCAFTGYDELFAYRLVESMSSNPNIARDTNFISNFFLLRLEIDNALKAISVGQDLQGSQQAIERAYILVTNSSLYFGN